jgi:hypothetical protein
MGIEIIIPLEAKARLSFEVLGAPKPYNNDPNNKARWSAVWLIPAGSDTKLAIDEAIQKLGTEKFGKKWKAIYEQIKGNPNRFCWQDGNLKADEYEGYEGMWSLSTHRYADKGRGIVLDKDGRECFNESTNEPMPGKAGKVYGGCFVRGKAELFTYTNTGSGIGGSWSVIQKTREGDAFGGGKPPTREGFDAIDDGEDDDAMGEDGDDIS